MGRLAHTLFFIIYFIRISRLKFANNFKNKAEAEIFEKDRYNFVC